jgi:hypothetical protein
MRHRDLKSHTPHGYGLATKTGLRAGELCELTLDDNPSSAAECMAGKTSRSENI